MGSVSSTLAPAVPIVMSKSKSGASVNDTWKREASRQPVLGGTWLVMRTHQRGCLLSIICGRCHLEAADNRQLVHEGAEGNHEVACIITGSPVTGPLAEVMPNGA
jgi:hypothetical protein